MNLIARTALCAALAVALPVTGQGQQPLTHAERAATVEGVARQLERGYVFQEDGSQMAQAVRGRAARGEYDAVVDGHAFARLLTEHLREVSHDAHVRVDYSAAVLPPEPDEGPAIPPVEEFRKLRDELAPQNYGLQKVEILPGNIGYIRWDYFGPPEFAGDTYAGAMAMVAETDALIIDLRGNMGSRSTEAGPMLSTYFFERPVHLIDVKWSFDRVPRQLWSWGHVPGRRYLDKPVYLLTSRRTFSGGEEFAYNLKRLGRATLVGDTTGGGANGGGPRRASDHFSVFVPFGRMMNPVDGSNWEGVGVAPDLAVASGKALLSAQLEALRALEATTTDERKADALRQARAGVSEQLGQFRRVHFELRGYPDAQRVGLAGEFNFWASRSTPMVRRGDRWVAEVEMEPGRHLYRFIVDGQRVLDPANPETRGEGRDRSSVRVVQ
jgi:retinol-binding protein 3